MKQERLKTVQAQALLENSRINFLLSSPLSEIVQESRTNFSYHFPRRYWQLCAVTLLLRYENNQDTHRLSAIILVRSVDWYPHCAKGCWLLTHLPFIVRLGKSLHLCVGSSLGGGQLNSELQLPKPNYKYSQLWIKNCGNKKFEHWHHISLRH